MAIERLMLISTVTNATNFAVNDNNQDYRVQASALLSYIQANLSVGIQQYTTQYAAPSATGFSVTITNGQTLNDDNIHLILTPTAGFAAGTLVLPATPGAIDKQEVLVNCTQAVTTLTINGNGATAVTGEPSTLAADAFFRLKFDLSTKTWYRVG